ncbi:MAG: alpha-amylase, partial [Candidatus Eremiobacteraeota bacterium]|nr:alpha-amylase [Candidatus Eremiobacteraeota bacterium]
MVIAQLFDKPFYQVQKTLPSLRKLGISHVLVSPPQKSHSSRRWWGRYQPVDFTRVEGPLGDATALYYLCLQANRLGMTIVADTVIHHLSNESRYLKIRANR